jgi:hypothetical protein
MVGVLIFSAVTPATLLVKKVHHGGFKGKFAWLPPKHILRALNIRQVVSPLRQFRALHRWIEYVAAWY